MKAHVALLLVLLHAWPAGLAAQTAPADAALGVGSAYVIGPDDVLEVNFWRQPDMSAEVVVRPDGRISLPLLNEIEAAGRTPAELLEAVLAEASRFVDSPSATVVVTQINSRKVFVTGAVAEPGSYPLTAPTTVLQLLAMAGGLTEWAKKGDIVVIRTTETGQVAFPFNYNDVGRQRNLAQNILLAPGDTIVVPE